MYRIDLIGKVEMQGVHVGNSPKLLLVAESKVFWNESGTEISVEAAMVNQGER